MSRKGAVERLLGWWRSPTPHYGSFLAAMLLVTLAHAVVVDTPLWRNVFDLTWFVLLVPAIRFTVAHKSLRWVGIVLGSLALAANILVLLHVDLPVAVARNMLAGGLLVATTVAAFSDVLQPGRISWNKIMGAISVYLLIGFCFAFVFTILAALQPDAFNVQLRIPGEMLPDPTAPFLYYSLVTLTTLGYGDLVPLSAAARTLSWLEAVCGQLYLTILVARLVGLHIVQATSQEHGS